MNTGFHGFTCCLSLTSFEESFEHKKFKNFKFVWFSINLSQLEVIFPTELQKFLLRTICMPNYIVWSILQLLQGKIILILNKKETKIVKIGMIFILGDQNIRVLILGLNV